MYVSLILSSVILAMAGFMYSQAKKRREMVYTVVYPARHPVTSEQLARAEKLTLKPAPNFQAKDAYGTQIDFEKYRNGHVAVIVFIVGGCPCSIEAQTMFNELQANYMDDVKFIGASKGTQAQALQFVKESQCIFPVVSDDGTIANLFDAKKSVYFVLIGTDGKIIKIYPGYCKSVASEINDKLAQLTGVTPKPITLAPLPGDNTAGCDIFPEAVPSKAKELEASGK